MITTLRVVVIANAPKVLLYKATGNTVIGIRTSGSLLVGGPTLSLANGFPIGGESEAIQLRNNDEIWVIATSTTVVYAFISA